MPIEYFELMGLLLVLYGFFRVMWWWEYRYFQRLPASKPYDGPITTPINTSVLVERIQYVREGHEARTQVPSSNSKGQLLLKKREEIARRAFFQKPPPPELPDEGHGMTLL